MYPLSLWLFPHAGYSPKEQAYIHSRNIIVNDEPPFYSKRYALS